MKLRQCDAQTKYKSKSCQSVRTDECKSETVSDWVKASVEVRQREGEFQREKFSDTLENEGCEGDKVSE